MGGGTVFSKLTPPNGGVIDSNGELRTWAAVTGSVTYGGLPSGNPLPLTGLTSAAGTGADLFSSTIQCGKPQLR